MRNLHRCIALLSCAALAIACLSASADEKKDKSALSGKWQKKGGDLKFEFGEHKTIKIFPHGDKAEIAIVCKYSRAKDGTVKAEITELEGKAELTEKAKQVVPVGTKFSFKYTIKNDAATLDDVNGDNIDALKSHLEGEYEMK